MAIWMVVPTLTAASYVLAALHRRRGLGTALLPLGPIYVTALVVLSRPVLLRPRWGLHLGLAAALVATCAGVALLVDRGRTPIERPPR